MEADKWQRLVTVATAQAKHKVERRLLLDVIVLQGAAILELLPSEDETLLVGWDALFVLDLGLHRLDRVGALDLEGDRLTGQRLHEDLHTSAQAKHKMERRLLLDVIVLQGAAILELLPSEDEALLVGWDALFVLDLGLRRLDRVGALDLEGDR